MGTQTSRSGQGTAGTLGVRKHTFISEVLRCRTTVYLDLFHLSLNFSISDLRVRDHSGCSAPHYAANINSPLKEEIIHMMVETLSHAGTHMHTHMKSTAHVHLHIHTSNMNVKGALTFYIHFDHTQREEALASVSGHTVFVIQGSFI